MSASRKNILPIIFSAIYTLFSILGFNFNYDMLLASPRYALNTLIIDILPLLMPVLALVFFLTEHKEYGFKNWLFPLGFGAKFCMIFMSICSTFSVLPLIDIASRGDYYALLFCSCLNCAALLCMFVGSLFNFKYLNFFKYGSLAAAISIVLSNIVEFTTLGGFAYLLTVSKLYAKINYFSLLTNISAILFYIGIFIFTLNVSKKTEG